MDQSQFLAWVGFSITYFVMVFGRIPGFGLDRTAIAIIGAIWVVGTGLFTFDQMIKAIDFDTIALLMGMMVLVGDGRKRGIMDWISFRILKPVKTPRQFLALTMLLSAVGSALLVNDTICLAMTPLLIQICRQKGFDPIPQLIALSISSNIGSVATLTGNPQNMIIGRISGVPYFVFFVWLFPIAIIAWGIAFAWIALIFRSSLAKVITEPLPKENSIPVVLSSKRSMILYSLIFAGTIIAFLVGVHLSVVALVAMAALILLRRDASWIKNEIDWELLLMFAGLFVVVHSFHEFVVSAWMQYLEFKNPYAIGVVVAVLSNLVSNVPAVLLMEPLIPKATGVPVIWLMVAMMSTFAGNLTIFGSVANLIVVEQAKREKITIRSSVYCLAGIPITLLTCMIGMFWFWILGV